MKSVFVFSVIFYASCFIKTSINMKPKEALCILYAGVVIPCFGRPSFYELVEEEIEDIDDKFDILNTTSTTTSTSTERPLEDDWKLRGRFRVQCVDETHIIPSKVVSLMSGDYWHAWVRSLSYWGLIRYDQSGTSRAGLQCLQEIMAHHNIKKLLQLAFQADDKDIQIWALCVLKKMGLMTDEGVFKMDVAMSKMPGKNKALAERLIDACLPNKALPPHLIAWTYIKCHSRVRGLKGNFSGLSVF